MNGKINIFAYVSSDCCKNYHRPKDQRCIYHNSEARRSKIRVPTWSGSGVSLPSGLLKAIFKLYTHMPWSRKRKQALLSLRIRTVIAS